MSGMSNLLRRGGLVLAAGAVLALSACSSSGSGSGSTPDRDESSGEITSSSDSDVFQLKVGDCLDLSSQDSESTVSSLPVTPCGESHDAEIYAEYTFTDTSFPDDVDSRTQEFCLTEFPTFVGMDYDTSELEITYLVPSESSWADGDRVSLCIVVDSAGGLTATMQGAAR